MTTRIYRYEVPVDDGWYPIRCGPPLHVGCRRAGIIEFWAHPLPEDQPVPMRSYRVYGTGQEMPSHGITYCGTALTPGGIYVWHLVSKLAVSS